MVHPFRYVHEGKPYYLLWDVESASLSVIDYAAYLFAKKRYATLTPQEEEAYFLLSEEDRRELSEEFDELEKDGSLNAEPIIKEFSKSADEVKALCLHICHDCNLACEYCFAGGGTYHTARDYMSAEVGKKAIDFLIEHSGKRKNLEVDFFGGEPLMNMGPVKEIVGYAREQGEKFGKRFAFTMTTNCLLLDDKTVEYLNEEMENVVLSIDGRKTVHNAVRHTRNGKDAYDVILQNALKMRKARGDKKYYVRGTFTAKNLDFSEDILALNDAGFDQISVEPVVLPEEHPLALKKEHLDKILAEYDRFTEEYITRRKDGRWFNFFHFMLDLEHGPCPNKRLTGCGAGTEYLAVTPTGDIYPCHQFAGLPDFLIGNVFSGIQKQSIRDTFAKNCVLAKEHCKKCFAKYYCGGGCAANAYNFTGSIDGQYEMGCELTKKRLELSLAVAALEKKGKN
ncbi:MAG: thioether cross-link-forming SCIFF peptide maturase [Clostridia bacterium]|nr:thioether cross-link-forming SCIFF peptide maturase [Clostridia bacterium]